MVDFIDTVLFCKQKTAYEMLISDWSSDVCASDLQRDLAVGHIDQDRTLGTGLPDGPAMHVAGEHDVGLVADALALVNVTERPVVVEIGRASCRARGCQYVSFSGLTYSCKKNKRYHTRRLCTSDINLVVITC